MATVTEHAAKRVRQRLGLPKRAATREFDRALQRGLREQEVYGPYKEYLRGLHERYGETYDYLTTPMGIFVVSLDTLVTVLNVPKEFASGIMACWVKKRGNNHDNRTTVSGAGCVL
jgi:hypothetical protein